MGEQPRDWLKKKFICEGMGDFDDKDVLRLMLYYAMPYKDTGDAAQLLLDKFGSISEVLDAPVSELVKVKGVGEHTAVLLNMLPQLCRLYTKDKYSGRKIQGLPEIAKFASDCFIGLTTEHFFLFCLDENLTLLSHCLISKGGVNSSTVDLRKIIEIMVSIDAANAVVAHNHPRGNCIPSQADLDTTAAIAKALNPLGMRLLDHVVVSVSDYTSMAEYPRKYGVWFKSG